VFGALALAISTTVGAGVLALPKAMSEAGLLGVILIIFPALAVYFLSLMVLEILKQEHRPIQLPALIGDVLGKGWKYLTYLTLIFSMYGALTAYLLGFGEQSSILINIDPTVASLILFTFSSLVVYRGTKLVEELDKPLSALLVLFLFLMAFLNLFNFQHAIPFFIPPLKSITSFMAVSLFALSSVNVLPEINYLAGRSAQKVVFLNALICTILYLFFALTTVGVLGASVTDLGTKGLALYYGGWFMGFISLFTLFALFTSFLGLGLSLRHIYNFDFHLSRGKATLATVLPPLLLFILSKFLHAGFLGVLSVAGELTLPLFSLIAIYAYVKVWKERGTSLPYPTFIVGFTSLFFLFLLASFILNIA